MISLNEKFTVGTKIIFSALETSSLDANGSVLLGDGTTSNVVVDATTTSTSATTGALVVLGGAGIGGNLHVVGNIHAPIVVSNVTGNLTGNVTGNLTGSVIGNVQAQLLTVKGTTQDTTFTQVNDITTWAYTGRAISISADETGSSGIYFKPDGTKMFIVGTTGDDVTEYTLSTPWDVATAVAELTTLAIGDTSPQDVFINSAGTMLYTTGATNGSVRQFALLPEWSVNGAAFVQEFVVSGQDATPTGIEFTPDMTQMFICGSTTDTIYSYALSVAGDISTATFVTSFFVQTQDSGPQGIQFNADGTVLYLLGSTGDDINQYNLSTPYDISTAVHYGRSRSLAGAEATPTGLYIDFGNGRAYINGSSSDTVREIVTNEQGLQITANSVHTTGSLYVSKDLEAAGNLKVDSTLTVGSGATFNSTLSVSSTTSISGTFTASGTSATLGSSTAAATYGVGTGATVSGSTKAINIGTSGALGSTTTITVGPLAGVGTISLNSPLTFVSNTAPTIVAGTQEYDGRVFYQTTQGTERGMVPSQQVYVLDANRGLAAQITTQTLFNQTFKVTSGTRYYYRAFLSISKANATANTINYGLVLAGGAVLAAHEYSVQSKVVAARTTPTALVQMSDYKTTAFDTLVVVTSSSAVSSVFDLHIEGYIDCSTGGTINPNILFATNVPTTPILLAKSDWMMYPVGPISANTSVQ